MNATWSAPGRVNLIGEHLDYNGGPVLPFAIDRRTTATATPRADGQVRVRSDGLGSVVLARPLRPESVPGWARYLAGAVWAFGETSMPIACGLDVSVTSSVPVGAGLSSSAAVECAVICALNDLLGAGLSRREIAAIALRTEREFVGVPCGPMDQLVSMLAEPDAALLIDTRDLSTEQVPLPLAEAGLVLLVVDTRVRHSLADGAYADRRAACEQAAATLGVDHLADAARDQAAGLEDPLLRRRAAHVVSETARVRDAVRLLRAGDVAALGPLMTASHRSLADDYEVSCRELDLAVDAALGAGSLGARMTGAGFGGCALVLCEEVAAAAVSRRVADAFAAERLARPAAWPVRPEAGAYGGTVGR